MQLFKKKALVVFIVSNNFLVVEPDFCGSYLIKCNKKFVVLKTLP